MAQFLLNLKMHFCTPVFYLALLAILAAFWKHGLWIALVFISAFLLLSSFTITLGAKFRSF